MHKQKDSVDILCIYSSTLCFNHVFLYTFCMHILMVPFSCITLGAKVFVQQEYC